jgi:hypothetical protein
MSIQHFKYSTGTTLNTIQKGNISIATAGSQDWGPTSSTGFYPETAPPDGGYTIYYMRSSGGPSVHVATGDTQAITFLKSFGATGSTISDVLSWASGQSNYYVQTGVTSGIVTSGLTLNLDASNASSYPGTGTTWTDLSGQNNTGTLINSPTFNSSNGGSIAFNGSNQYTITTNTLTLSNATFIAWIYSNSTQTAFNGIIYSRRAVTNDVAAGMNFQGSNQLGYEWNGAPNTYNWQSGLIVPNSAWCMVAITIQSTQAVGYLYQSSGITSATNNVSHPTINPVVLNVARDPYSTRLFNGNVGQALTYNTTLTSTELLQNYNATKTRFGL